MLLLSTIACGPGWVSYPGGESDLESALWIKGSIEGVSTLILALSNSKLGCELADVADDEDPALVEAAWLELSTALYREGARNVVVWLRGVGGEPLGSYRVDPSAEGAEREADALYMAVTEAALDEEVGLLRSYAPTSYDVREAGSGSVELTRLNEDRAEGRFDFEDIEVAGRFRAEHCDTWELFEQLGLVDDDPVDLFGAYEDGRLPDEDTGP